MLSLNYSMTDSLPRMLLPSTRTVDMFSLTMVGSTPCPSDIALFSRHFTYNPRGKEILHFMTLCQNVVDFLILFLIKKISNYLIQCYKDVN